MARSAFTEINSLALSEDVWGEYNANERERDLSRLVLSRNRACPHREPFFASVARGTRKALQRAKAVAKGRTQLFKLGCAAYGALLGGILRADEDFCKLFSTLPTFIFGYRHSKSPDLGFKLRFHCLSCHREVEVTFPLPIVESQCTILDALSAKRIQENPAGTALATLVVRRSMYRRDCRSARTFHCLTAECLHGEHGKRLTRVTPSTNVL
jgi:hypothetical protein